MVVTDMALDTGINMIKNLLAFLFLCGVCLADKPKVVIYLDETVRVEKCLKTELTADWVKRLSAKNPSKEQVAFSEAVNARQKKLKDFFDIEFRDRYKEHEEFSIKLRNTFYPLPNDEFMAESTTWIMLFEYIKQCESYDDAVQEWKDEYIKVQEKYVFDLAKVEQKWIDDFIAANQKDGWFAGEVSDGVFNSKNEFVKIVDLGFVRPSKDHFPKKPAHPKWMYDNFKEFTSTQVFEYETPIFRPTVIKPPALQP